MPNIIFASQEANIQAVRSLKVGPLVSVDLKQSLALVRQLNIYAYDAYLLVCAMQLGTPLLTLDAPLKVAAASLGIEVMEI